MQERNNSTTGISVQLRFTRSRSTRLSCTQHEFFVYIHWFSNLYHAFGRSVIIMLCLERRFISQSFCKCDRGLSQESIRKARYFECSVFLFATDHRHQFCSPRICQHEDIWPIRTWYQNLVLWNGGIQTYDWIVSHDAPRFMLYYHCVRDISWSVFFSMREMSIAALDEDGFQACFGSAASTFENVELAYIHCALKEIFRVTLKGFSCVHWSVENSLVRSVATKHKV